MKELNSECVETFSYSVFTGNYLIRNGARILDLGVELRHFSPEGIVTALGGGIVEFLCEFPLLF